MKTSKTYFISGHGDTSLEEWLAHYKPNIDKALKENASFVVGDFRGVDVISFEYLKDKSENVTVYHCFERPRYMVDTISSLSKNWKLSGGFLNDTERDTSMTNNSVEDILWIKLGKEKSGTAKNLQRRNTIKENLNLKPKQ